jgi:hypothetical protein
MRIEGGELRRHDQRQHGAGSKAGEESQQDARCHWRYHSGHRRVKRVAASTTGRWPLIAPSSPSPESRCQNRPRGRTSDQSRYPTPALPTCIATRPASWLIHRWTWPFPVANGLGQPTPPTCSWRAPAQRPLTRSNTAPTLRRVFWSNAIPNGVSITGQNGQTPWLDFGGSGRDVTTAIQLFYRVVLPVP